MYVLMSPKKDLVRNAKMIAECFEKIVVDSELLIKMGASRRQIIVYNRSTRLQNWKTARKKPFI